jgi:hypothetical protein
MKDKAADHPFMEDFTDWFDFNERLKAIRKRADTEGVEEGAKLLQRFWVREIKKGQAKLERRRLKRSQEVDDSRQGRQLRMKERIRHIAHDENDNTAELQIAHDESLEQGTVGSSLGGSQTGAASPRAPPKKAAIAYERSNEESDDDEPTSSQTLYGSRERKHERKRTNSLYTIRTNNPYVVLIVSISHIFTFLQTLYFFLRIRNSVILYTSKQCIS